MLIFAQAIGGFSSVQTRSNVIAHLYIVLAVTCTRELAAVAATTPFGCKTTYTVVLKTAEGLKIKSMSHDEKKGWGINAN